MLGSYHLLLSPAIPSESLSDPISFCASNGVQNSSSGGRNLGYAGLPSEGRSWIGFKSTVGMAVLTLLAIPALLQAQSSECRVSGRQECSDTAEPRRGNGLSAADIGLGFNVRVRSGELDGTVPTKLPAEILPLYRPAVLDGLCARTTRCADLFFASARSPHSVAQQAEPVSDGDGPAEGSKPPSAAVVRKSPAIDSERNFFYKNKLELSLEGGWLPVNIPFVFDVFLGDGYTTTPLKYTLEPIIASVRWQVDDVDGPWIFRGNWDLEASGAAVLIPTGPETRYFAFILGFRRNFVPRRGRFAPYFDGRLGMGEINAKEPQGVLYAQGQNFTFTMNMGSGVRYNFSPRYAIWSGLNWMHISNLYLSQPQFANYGINVYGPMFGIDVRLGRLRLHHHAAE